jgi:hypothetical protein
VVYPSKFNLYFAYNLVEGNLSEVEFTNARMLDQDKLNSQIKEWIEKGLELELKNRFYLIKDFDNKDDFEKVIRAIFFMANLPRVNQGFLQGHLIGYDGEDLERKLSDYGDKLSTGLYTNYGDKEGLKSFIKGLFAAAQPPYSFEADFIHYVSNKSFASSFLLTKEEMESLLLDYFKKYCESVTELDNYIYHLFHSCKQSNWIQAQGGYQTSQEVIPKEAIDIMKNFLNKDLDGLLFSWISVDPFDKERFSVSNFPETLFGSWTEFEKYLLVQDETKWKYISEFKQFFNAFKAQNFSIYISFDFKQIPIDKKLQKNK